MQLKLVSVILSKMAPQTRKRNPFAQLLDQKLLPMQSELGLNDSDELNTMEENQELSDYLAESNNLCSVLLAKVCKEETRRNHDL